MGMVPENQIDPQLPKFQPFIECTYKGGEKKMELLTFDPNQKMRLESKSGDNEIPPILASTL